jgi:hypothetical protein
MNALNIASPGTKQEARQGMRAVFYCLIFCAASWRLIHFARIDSTDLHVYWKAAVQWTQFGRSPYLFDAQDHGLIFKYPPWILPFLLPLGYLSESAARLFWAGLELVCLGYSIFKLSRWENCKGMSVWIAAAFWFIWAPHFRDGQWTLFILAAALMAYPESEKNNSPLKWAFFSLILSSKLFSMISLLGVHKRISNFRTGVWTLGLWVGLILLVLFFFHLRQHPMGIGELLQQWIQAANSGGSQLALINTRGQMNQGFPAAILRLFHVPADATWADGCAFFATASTLGCLWSFGSQGYGDLRPIEKYAGWLSLGVICHPLAWHHSFVLAYPLAVLSCDRAFHSKGGKTLKGLTKDLKNVSDSQDIKIRQLSIALCILGVLCIGWMVPAVIGPDLVKPLELISLKSWGVCFLGVGLILASKSFRI